jgi:3-deoxy-manno-octulosonate cytidylyltransferase (CMP-KDO synthetase)
VIPARYQSTRLPGKPLADIIGKSMVLRVAEQAMKSRMLSEVIVATDSKLIEEHLKNKGVRVVMTDPEIRTGTDRCFEAAKDIDYDILVNIQGDEPLLDPLTIDRLVEGLLDSDDAVCSTPVIKIKNSDAADNKNVVKVVMDSKNYAMYFSRSRIPSDFRNEPVYYKHIGLYAYRKDFLKTFVKSESTRLELSESLEQLRILENGYKIKCVEVDKDSLGVDTMEDLEKVRKIIKERESQIENSK